MSVDDAGNRNEAEATVRIKRASIYFSRNIASRPQMTCGSPTHSSTGPV